MTPSGAMALLRSSRGSRVFIARAAVDLRFRIKGPNETSGFGRSGRTA